MTDPQDPFAPPPPGTPPAQPYGAPAYGEPLPYGTPVPQVRNGFGIWSLVLGVASFFCLFLFVVPSVLAIVFGFLGRGRARRKEATNGGVALAGIITGFVSLLMAVAVYAFMAANWNAIQRYYDCTDAAQGNTSAEQACSDQLGEDLFGIRPQR